MNIVIKKGRRGEDRSISHDDDVVHKGLAGKRGGDNCSATRSVSARCATGSSATSVVGVHSGAGRVGAESCWAAGCRESGSWSEQRLTDSGERERGWV